MRARCDRLWEGEALVDGRLTGPERLSFEKHASACLECQDEVAELTSLRAVMAHAPSPRRTTPFKRHALRTLLLRTANDRLVGRRPRRLLFPYALAWAAFVGMVCLFLQARAWSRNAAHAGLPQAAEVVGPPTFEVMPIAEASWADHSDGATGRVLIENGTLSVHVRHLLPGQRFLMTLPDGELEVHGTRFIVEVIGRRTERVEVTEGVVSLRWPGQPEQRLMAGQRWVAPALAVSPVLPLPAPTSSMNDAPSVPSQHPSVRAKGGRQGRSGATVAFEAAVEALHEQAYERAETLLAQFSRSFPDDPRAEDAAFLRAAARSGAGDRSGAALLARQYLTRFPHGLRRQEAERLTRPEGDATHSGPGGVAPSPDDDDR